MGWSDVGTWGAVYELSIKDIKRAMPLWDQI